MKKAKSHVWANIKSETIIDDEKKRNHRKNNEITIIPLPIHRIMNDRTFVQFFIVRQGAHWIIEWRKILEKLCFLSPPVVVKFSEQVENWSWIAYRYKKSIFQCHS